MSSSSSHPPPKHHSHPSYTHTHTHTQTHTHNHQETSLIFLITSGMQNQRTRNGNETTMRGQSLCLKLLPVSVLCLVGNCDNSLETPSPRKWGADRLFSGSTDSTVGQQRLGTLSTVDILFLTEAPSIAAHS